MCFLLNEGDKVVLTLLFFLKYMTKSLPELLELWDKVFFSDNAPAAGVMVLSCFWIRKC